MRNYSVRYLDAQGRTQGSEFLPFEDNRSAVDFARIGIISNAIVEVWRDNDLVERLYRDKAPIVLPESGLAPGAAIRANAASARADSRKSLEAWDNEGGGAKPQPAPGVR